MEDEIKKYKFSADREINSKADDLLGRVEFAESIASAIRGWDGEDSLIVALNGPWGSGKSSIKNMVLESLREKKDKCPEIVEFNPWYLSGEDKITKAFFYELSVLIGKTDKSNKYRSLARKVRLYSTRFSVGSFLAKSLLQLIFLFVSIIGIIGGFAQAISRIIGVIALIIFSILKWGGAFSDKIATMFEASSEISQKTLLELKKEIIEELKQLNKTFLIVLDDIDRLTSKEIRLLFRLIKANADFPKITYLLLFQRDIVEKCLSEEIIYQDNNSGKEFLEKIVQVPFNIPKIEQEKLRSFLEEELKEIFEEKIITNNRWDKLYRSGLIQYFHNLRDIKRFINTLKFHVGIFKNDGVLDVNSIDLVLIETLRVFEPDVYDRLPEIKWLLLGIKPSLISELSDEKEIDKKAIMSIVEHAEESQRDYIIEILQGLFPHIEELFGGTSYDQVFHDEWEIDKRICSLQMFDRYFLLRLTENDITQSELNNVLSRVDNRFELVPEFRVFIKRGLFPTLLSSLRSYTIEGKIDTNNAIPFITALFDISDELPERIETITYDGFTKWIIIEIINWFLIQEKDNSRKWDILKNSIKYTDGFSAPVLFVINLRERYEKNELLFLKENEIEYLEKICLKKIEKASQSSLLISKPFQLQSILKYWSKLSSPNEPINYIKRIINEKDGLLSFLEAFLEITIRATGPEEHNIHEIKSMNLSNIEEYVTIDFLQQKLKNLQIKSEELSGRKKYAVDSFFKAINRRKQGKHNNGY